MKVSLLRFKLTRFAPAVAVLAFLSGIALTGALAQSVTKNWTGVVYLVAAGDQIVIDPATVKSGKNVITVEWSQGLKGRTADYVHTVAVIDKADPAEVLSVFIQRDLVDDFLSKCGTGHDHYCPIVVGPEFQYGQSNTNSVRFLVYHDKNSKPYSRRFIDKTTSRTFYSLGKQVTKQLGRDDLIRPVQFTNSQYLTTNARKVFRGDKYLKDITAAPAASDATRAFDRLSPEKKIERLERKSRWCFDQTHSIFGKKSQTSDGRWSDPGKNYIDRCLNWQRDAWIRMAKPARSDMEPAELGRTEIKFERCLKQVEQNHGHRGKEELRRRAAAEYRCEINRQLELLALGAFPLTHYQFYSAEKLNEYVASGAWRLVK